MNAASWVLDVEHWAQPPESDLAYIKSPAMTPEIRRTGHIQGGTWCPDPKTAGLSNPLPQMLSRAC